MQRFLDEVSGRVPRIGAVAALVAALSAYAAAQMMAQSVPPSNASWIKPPRPPVAATVLGSKYERADAQPVAGRSLDSAQTLLAALHSLEASPATPEILAQIRRIEALLRSLLAEVSPQTASAPAPADANSPGAKESPAVESQPATDAPPVEAAETPAAPEPAPAPVQP